VARQGKAWIGKARRFIGKAKAREVKAKQGKAWLGKAIRD
jgi:hypothetical protein